MLSRPWCWCTVTPESLAWYQPALCHGAPLLMLTLPWGLTTITICVSGSSHLPVSCLGITVVVAEVATPVTVAASTNRARRSAARRSRFLLFMTPSTVLACRCRQLGKPWYAWCSLLQGHGSRA